MARVNRQFFLGCAVGFVLAIVLLLGGFFGSMVLFKGLYIQSMAGRLRAPPIISGLEADYAWRVKSLDGRVMDMADTKGKVVFLTFWHPSCPACLAEIPSINRLYETLRAEAEQDSVLFVCVSTGTLDGLQQTVEEEDIQFPTYVLEGERPGVFDAKQGPVTFIIASNGDIVFKHVGGARWDDEAVVSFLKLLSRSAPNTG